MLVLVGFSFNVEFACRLISVLLQKYVLVASNVSLSLVLLTCFSHWGFLSEQFHESPEVLM